jgi:hypothetical protein
MESHVQLVRLPCRAGGRHVGVAAVRHAVDVQVEITLERAMFEVDEAAAQHPGILWIQPSINSF